MPKRVLDFDALWASDKLASCAEWAQSEYAWLYGLADASGSFEMTNLRVIWGRVAAIRKNLTLERLQEVFDEFIARGLLFTWEESGKRYGHWTGSDVPGRLPAPSWRMRLEKLAPPVPCEALAAYSARFGGSKEGMAARGGANVSAASLRPEAPDAETRELKHHLEEPQAQDWDLGLDLEEDLDLEKEKTVCPPQRMPFFGSTTPKLLGEAAGNDSGARQPAHASSSAREIAPRDLAALEDMRRKFGGAKVLPDLMLKIYEGERGELPAAGAMTPARRRRCERWLAAGIPMGEFTAAVRLAAATPFLAGDGNRGWQASFDWLIANRGNVRKVLAGEYAPSPSRLRASGRTHADAGKSRGERPGPADLYAGAGPRPADCGLRVNPAALERIRARQDFVEREKGRDDHALFAPDNTKAPRLAAFAAQPRAAPGNS